MSLRADVTFTARDGHAVTTAAILSRETLDGFRSGRPVQVRYRPDRPGVARIVGEEDEGGSWLPVVLGGAALGYAGYGFLCKPGEPGPRRHR